MTHPHRARRAVALVGTVTAKLQAEGPRGVAQRAIRRAYQRFDAGVLDFGLHPDEVADSTALSLRVPPPVPGGTSIRVGWLCTPPPPGSGGHTTMFRMVRAMEEAGHSCEIVLHDRHGGDTAARAAVIRSAWPWVRAGVRSIQDGLGDLDVVVATGWESAHVLAKQEQVAVQRAYFIQDYEPMFYPHGTDHTLATDSYRFGFTNIALGGMVQHRLTMLGVPSTQVSFGRDTETYQFTNTGARSGVAFFARPDTPRRGYRLGVLALAEFHRRCPEQEIHVFGADVSGLDFPVTRHGRPTPAQLSELYNRCAAGLALSFTNVSLVPDEMLAAGCVPVVNDTEDTRAVFDNACAEWAVPTPVALGVALERVVRRATPESAAEAAASVAGNSWDTTGQEVRAVLEALARGTHTATPPAGRPVAASAGVSNEGE